MKFWPLNIDLHIGLRIAPDEPAQRAGEYSTTETAASHPIGFTANIPDPDKTGWDTE